MKNKDARDIPETDEQTLWLQEVVLQHTPTWAHLLAFVAEYRGMQWLHHGVIPLARKLTQVSVKTETRMQRPHKGFRSTTMLETQVLRVFKRGRLVAEKEFGPFRISNSMYNKIV